MVVFRSQGKLLISTLKAIFWSHEEIGDASLRRMPYHLHGGKLYVPHQDITVLCTIINSSQSTFCVVVQVAYFDLLVFI